MTAIIIVVAKPGQTLQSVEALFSEPIAWCQDLLLKGAGYSTPYYLNKISKKSHRSLACVDELRHKFSCFSLYILNFFRFSCSFC